MNAILERGPTIGVRGEITASYLESLGYRDVEVIGCPSFFLNGDRIGVEKRLERIDRHSNLTINISPYIERMGPFVMSATLRYPRLTYMAQDRWTLARIVDGEPPEEARLHDLMPNHLSHPLMRPGRVWQHIEPWPWIEDLRRFDFAFGSRIHGNIAAILAGTPSYVLAHDSRTLELARYFRIPHRPMTEVDASTDPANLYEEADYSELLAGHADRYTRFIAYLERHGLHHIFEVGEDPTAFDREIAALQFPGPFSPPGRARRALNWTQSKGDATSAWVGRKRRGLRRRAGNVRRRVLEARDRPPAA